MFNQPFGQALTDSSRRFTQVNRVLCEMLGLETRALLQRSIEDITHPDDWPGNDMQLDRLRTHDEPFTIVKRYLRADGTVVWVQNYVSQLHDAEGRVATSALIRPVLPAMGEALRWGATRAAPLSQGQLARLSRLPSGGVH